MHLCARHEFSKDQVPAVRLVAGLGLEGDAHAGVTVQHRSRVRRDPNQPNLRQVHLLHSELLEELGIEPGRLGENITTRGVDLLGLSAGTRLDLGDTAVVEVTGLRNPCVQIEAYRPGLLSRVLDRDADGGVVRRAGVMAVVLFGGNVHAGDVVGISPPAVHVALGPV